MIVLKRNRDQINTALENAFLVSGLSISSGLAKELYETIGGLLDTEYVNLYALEKNTRIDTCNNSFLDVYGLFFDEPRISQSYARVETLNNVSIFLVNSSGSRKKGKEVTLNGEGIPIPKGTALVDRSNNVLFYTSESVLLTEELVYVKCIAANQNVNYVATGTLVGAQIDLLSNDAIDPNLLSGYGLGCNNESEISISKINADETTYRFTLYSKGQSVNLISNDKINTLLDNLEVVQLIVDKSNIASSGVVVYVETKNIETDSLVLQEVAAQLKNIFPEGTYISTRPFIYSTLHLSLRISTVPGFDDLTIRENFKKALITNINVQKSTTPYNFNNIINQTKNEVENVSAVSIDYIGINGKKLLDQVYVSKNIEKLFAYSSTVSYKI